ncbi:MAG TPA: prepilin-type N-terminal cleavage/methylation domain-containing protein [Gemmatimonadaceae bacterium]|nr:prepilin-type N-terminal cleavage/methylation domain-containing protein [Gemmatimonadaceae bacterium]
MTEKANMKQFSQGASVRRRKRSGFILMEVIVAMTLLALIMTPLAAMVYKITARSHRSIGNTYRNAVVMEEVNLLESLPYDNLPNGTTTTTVTSKPYPYTMTITIAQYYQKWQLKGKSVQLILTPANPLYRPDTVKFIRSSANTLTALTDDGL